MPIKMRRFRSTQITENGPGKLLYIIMVSAAFTISGVLEGHSQSEQSTPDFISQVNQSDVGNGQVRRYCDPPNMTAIHIYYDSSEEKTVDEYDFLQNQEATAENNISVAAIEEQTFFDWGLVLSFFPACFLTSKFGPFRVFSHSVLYELVLLTILTIAKLHQKIRKSFFGFLSGIIILSFYEMTSHFVSSGRNSLFFCPSVRLLGLAIGELYMVLLVERNCAFYINSIITVVWFIVWSRVQFKSSKNSIYYAGHNDKSKLKTPWKNILCSGPVWMTIAAIFGASCGISCIFVVMKLYLNYVYLLQVDTLSAAASFFHVGFAAACCYIINYLIESRIVSVTSSRRIVVYVSHFIPAGLLFILGFVGCDKVTPLIFYCLEIMIIGSNYIGAFSSPLDLAPKYAGPILALCFTFGSLGSLSMDYLTSYVLTKPVFVSWRFIFSLNSLILLLTAIFFMLRGSGSVQPWNDPDHRQAKEKRNKDVQEGKVSTITPVPKPRTKSIYMVEKKILKVLHVQEPEKFTRVRAYSTSLTSERHTENGPNIYRPSNKKRASIS